MSCISPWLNKTKKVAIVNDIGAIDKIVLPVQWVEHSSQSPDPGGFALSSHSRDFSPEDTPSATLSLFYRGTLVSEGSAQRFNKLLQEMDHELSEAEIEAVSQILSKLADEDAFKKRNCYTLNITGRRVLVVDGEWKKSQTQFHGLLLSVDESGRVIQEIFFEAPPGAFEKYLEVALNSMRTIEWKRR